MLEDCLIIGTQHVVSFPDPIPLHCIWAKINAVSGIESGNETTRHGNKYGCNVW